MPPAHTAVHAVQQHAHRAHGGSLVSCNSEYESAFEEKLTKSMRLSISQRVWVGEHKTSTLAECQTLFELLDSDGDGCITFEELKAWLVTVIKEIDIPSAFFDDLEEAINESGKGVVSSMYFHSMLCYGPIHKLFDDLTMQIQAVSSKRETLKVPRSFVVQRCQWRTERDDAFRTLPFSIAYFCLFLALVVTHLRVWERHWIERGMESHVAEWGHTYFGPYLYEHVPNVDNIFIWLSTSAMQFAFDYCNPDSDKLVPTTFCEKAPRNMLISDILLRQTLISGEEKQEWLMNAASVSQARSYANTPCTQEALDYNKIGCLSIHDPYQKVGNPLHDPSGKTGCLAFGTNLSGTYCLHGTFGHTEVDSGADDLHDSRCVCCGGLADVSKSNVGINNCPDWYTTTTTTTNTRTTHTMTTTSTTAHHYEGALQSVLGRLEQLRREHWLNKNTRDVYLEFSTYNEDVRLFCAYQVGVAIDEYGLLTIADYSWALPSEAYPHSWVFILDGLYVLFLLIPLESEVKEICRAVRHRGRSGFIEYWGFWNAVDWFQILVGFALVVLWILFCLRVGSENLQSLLQMPDFQLRPEVLRLDTDSLHTIVHDLKEVLFVYRLLHVFMAANTIAILSKFVKSFRCNSWLNVVSATVGNTALDVFHFMVIFAAVYMGFSLIAHIMIGNDMMAFNSFGASINTAFYCLQGDFGWYSDLSTTEIPLGSGTPYTLVAIWFWSFMIFTVLFMLNMLLTIVVEGYLACTADIKDTPESFRPSIFLQTRRYFDRRKKYKAGGWTPLFEIYERLIADDPAHPEEIVTQKSLMAAFPLMKVEQAEFLMDWWSKDKDATVRIKAADNELERRLLKMNKVSQTIGEQVHVLLCGVKRCENQIDMIEKRTARKQRKTSPTAKVEETNVAYIDVARTLETQLRVMKELATQFGKQQESTQRLAEALSELTRVGKMPTS